MTTQVPEVPEASAAPEGRGRRSLRVWQETVILAVLAVVLAVVVKTFLVQAFYIPSASMEPGLVKNDRILVQKVSSWDGGQPHRGDVVVFADPGGWLPASEDAGPTNPVARALAKIGLAPTGGHLVKRVIGVAGDTITCCDSQGRISVNGKAIDEKVYVKNDPQSPCNGPMTGDCDWSEGPVPAGHVFVMGDNRDHSADSTVHLCLTGETDCVPGHEYVSDDLIVGTVMARIWPFSRIGLVSGHSEVFSDVPAGKGTSDSR